MLKHIIFVYEKCKNTYFKKQNKFCVKLIKHATDKIKLRVFKSGYDSSVR